MTSNAFGTTCVSAPRERLDQAGGDPHPLPSRRGVVLPLLLIAAALSAVLLMSANLWRLGAQALDSRAEDMDWTFAQAQVEALRLHEAAENYAENPAAAPEFARQHALLASRLAQIEAGPPGRLADSIGLGDDIAAARRALLDHGPAAGRPGGPELAALAAQLVRLDRVLAAAGTRARSAHDAVRAGRVDQLRQTLVLGASLVLLAGLLGLALLALRMLRIERRLRESRRLELDLQRERDEASYMRNIGAVISHQMRTPLAVIDSTAQRVQTRCGAGEGADVGIAMLRIRRQVRRVLHFMDQAMLAGRIEAQGLEANPQPVAVEALIGMLMDSDSVRGQGDRLVLPPPSVARLRAFCDRDLAVQALANIVENALKYSPDGSPVELQLAEADGMAVISVIDHGRGIPPAEQAAIFQRFRRGSNAGDRPGTGIGLWLAQRLAESQGGTIRVASDGRTGARFDLCLPAAGGGTVPAGAQHGRR